MQEKQTKYYICTHKIYANRPPARVPHMVKKQPCVASLTATRRVNENYTSREPMRRVA